MCWKQTSVSHSSTESEVVTLDAGLRVDGIRALDLWDLVIEVLHSSPNQHCIQGNLCSNEQSGKRTNTTTKKHLVWDELKLINVDHVTTNAKLSHFGALLYMFEDNEAVSKMITRGRSPTLRHVSRTHRVALGWLVDRIHLDPKIQINYVDTKNQLADILTRGNFTRDEPSPLVQHHGHVTVCIQPFQLNQLLSDHVEKASSARKTMRIRTSGIEDCRLVSNSAELQCILQPGDTQSKEFKFGSHQYRETCIQRFE